MQQLKLAGFHQKHGAQFTEWGDASIPAHYGDADSEYRALAETAGLIDLSHRGLLKITGEDRVRFLNGQTTNDVAALKPGEVVYTAFTNQKGKMRADGTIMAFPDSFWIDVESGRAQPLRQDLEKFIIADDVAVENISARYNHFGLLGPQAPVILQALKLDFPSKPDEFRIVASADYGELIVPRSFFGGDEFVEIFAPVDRAEGLASALDQAGGRWAGWLALEKRRVELGIPRFGIDMDENTMPPEAGIQDRAISYTKGCYVGQEVISRIKSVGHVNRTLVRLKLSGSTLRGAKLVKDSAEVGWVTSCAEIPSKG